MYRPTDIKAGLAHLWGWRQNYDSAALTIDETLTVSETGQYFQEVHPLLTLANVKAIAPDFSRIVPPIWSALTTYPTGYKVSLSGKTYRALTTNTNKTPASNPNDWQLFDAFSEWLSDKTQGSLLKAIRNFWDAKMSEKKAANILENKTLFNGTGRITDIIPSGTNLVGFEIVPIRANGITVKIERIGLQMTGQSEVRLYLMHSSRPDPVKIITLNRIRNAGMQWFDQVDLFLPYVSSENDAGGSWYLVYNQSSLAEGTNAINRNRDWSAKPCGTCDREEVAAYQIWSRYLEIHPFKTDAFTAGDFNEDFNNDFAKAGLSMWDVSKNLYTYTTNYGINLQISIECDVTDLIIDQRRAFQNVIGLQVACDMLREMAFNPNFNINRTAQGVSQTTILYELDGDSQGYKKGGLGYQLEKAMKAVSVDVESLSKVCFPCNNRGIKYRAT